MIATVIIAIIIPVLAQFHTAGLPGIDGMIIVRITMAIQRCQYHIKTIKDWFPIRQSVLDAVIGFIIRYNRGML